MTNVRRVAVAATVVLALATPAIVAGAAHGTSTRGVAKRAWPPRLEREPGFAMAHGPAVPPSTWET